MSQAIRLELLVLGGGFTGTSSVDESVERLPITSLVRHILPQMRVVQGLPYPPCRTLITSSGLLNWLRSEPLAGRVSAEVPRCSAVPTARRPISPLRGDCRI